MKKLLCALVITVCVSSGFAYYQAQQGRWISRDPLGEYGGLHLYGFVNNNPQNLFDSLGLRFGPDPRQGPGYVSPKQVNKIQAEIYKINKIKDKQGRICYEIKLYISTANIKSVKESLKNPDIDVTYVEGHGNKQRERTLGDGKLSDQTMHDIAKESKTRCKTFGCYGDDNPNRMTTPAASYNNILTELKTYVQKDCCDTPLKVEIFFGPK